MFQLTNGVDNNVRRRKRIRSISWYGKKKIKFPRNSRYVFDRCDFPVADFPGRRIVVMNGCIACRRFSHFCRFDGDSLSGRYNCLVENASQIPTGANTDRILNWRQHMTSSKTAKSDLKKRLIYVIHEHRQI